MKDAARLVLCEEPVELLEQTTPPLFASRIAIVFELVVPNGQIVGEIVQDAVTVQMERRGDLQRECDDPVGEPARFEECLPKRKRVDRLSFGKPANPMMRVVEAGHET